MELVNKLIEEEKQKYAVPLYTTEFLKNNSSEIQMTVDPDVFLEMLILRIRGETIKFASSQKKKLSKLESSLISDIEALESSVTLQASHLSLLEDKKMELQQIRKVKMKGQTVRSRLQWLQEGEKPSKFLCNLEKRNYIEKTIKKVKLNNGSIVTDQEEVLNHVRNYYANLFKSRENDLLDINFEQLGLSKSKPISEEDDLGTLLTVNELGNVLKKMKHNKVPGIDGITSEFLKVFWGNLKHFVAKALNCCFTKGRLSISLRQAIISCLPKTEKDRSLIKNWRPISLLSVIYKMASGVIAQHLKGTLDGIISKCQTGFIKGRFISDSTRLVYDILHATEVKNIPGLLMLIDFEKAFDSLSWNFLYKTLKFFGYSDNLIKWIKIFNTDVVAFVLQSGFLSREIQISRGCRQGDPISPYLFLIGAEILAKMIKINPGIVGIKFGDIEFKLTQFADDTTLILDGSQRSLQTALNVLETYGDISGLRMNKDKTKVIWIGKKRLSNDKLNVSSKLEWGITNFKLLGINFSIDLKQIPLNNYGEVLQKIEKDVKKWNLRYLTPMGKITVIKTLFIPKCIHLLTSLERSENFLRDLNKILYAFLWSGGPDKIKRTTICSDYTNGGLKMINVHYFEKALKISWIKKMLSNQDSQWFRLLQATHLNIEKVLLFGDQWCTQFLKLVTNPFWYNILMDWIDFNKRQDIIEETEPLQNSIWYNSKISDIPLYFPDWFNHRIYFVNDIIDVHGNVLSINQLQTKFNCKLNILNYFTVRSKVTTFLKCHKVVHPCVIDNLSYPFHLKYIIQSQTGCRKICEIYKNLDDTKKPLCESIWEPTIKMDYSDQTNYWPIVYKICFRCVQDNNLSWFQYRILFKILGTKDYLKKIKITEADKCGLCKKSEESIFHLLSLCDQANLIWDGIRQWIKNKIGFDLGFNHTMKIIGYLNMDKHFWPLNLVLLVARKYLYWCSKNNFSVNIFYLQREIKSQYTS